MVSHDDADIMQPSGSLNHSAPRRQEPEVEPRLRHALVSRASPQKARILRRRGWPARLGMHSVQHS